jgi:hypothetical protein
MMLRDYAKMTLGADLDLLQRLHCVVAIVEMARRREA